MYTLKQSTAITLVFFAHDVNGDGVTGIADGSWTKRISKNSGAFAAMTVTITEMENGWYSFPLSTSHSDSLGILSMSFSATACKRVNIQFRIFARINDDFAYPATTGRSLAVDASGNIGADVNLWKASAPNALQSGRVDGYVGAMASNVLTATAINADAITAAKLAADVADEIWDEVMEGTLTARQSMMAQFAAMAGKSAGGGATPITFRNYADTLNRISATVDSNGNRTAITYNFT